MLDCLCLLLVAAADHAKGPNTVLVTFHYQSPINEKNAQSWKYLVIVKSTILKM